MLLLAYTGLRWGKAIGRARVAVSARAKVKAVQKMLGHALAATTLDVYAACSAMTWRPWRGMRPVYAKVWPKCGQGVGKKTCEGLLGAEL